MLRRLPLCLLSIAMTASAQDDVLDASKSASLAGVAKDQDATAADLSTDATYVLPGFIDKTITLDNLRRRFGSANIKRATIDGAEGEQLKGIVLFATDPARRAELVFDDQERTRGIDSIRVRGRHSRWHLVNGVHLGMTLQELAAANGKTVSFNGLDWDYGGVVTDLHNGTLAQPSNATPSFSISLNHGDAPDGAYPSGEGDYRSDDKRYPKQGSVLYVGEIDVSFGDAEGN
jgi:hypothetical protein